MTKISYATFGSRMGRILNNFNIIISFKVLSSYECYSSPFCADTFRIFCAILNHKGILELFNIICITVNRTTIETLYKRFYIDVDIYVLII